MRIFKDDRQEQSYLHIEIGAKIQLIARQVFISLSDDACDNAPMCDLYGEVDDDRFFVYAVTITGTRINITSLFTSAQLEELGDEMSNRPQIYEVI